MLLKRVLQYVCNLSRLFAKLLLSTDDRGVLFVVPVPHINVWCVTCACDSISCCLFLHRGKIKCACLTVSWGVIDCALHFCVCLQITILQVSALLRQFDSHRRKYPGSGESVSPRRDHFYNVASLMRTLYLELILFHCCLQCYVHKNHNLSVL